MMKAVLSCAILALLATPAVAQQRHRGDLISNRTRGGSDPAPNEQLDPGGFYNYMIAHNYCPESPGLHPAWHARRPDERCINFPSTIPAPAMKEVPSIKGVLTGRYGASNWWQIIKGNRPVIFNQQESHIGSQPKNTTGTTGKGATRAPMPRPGDPQPGRGYNNGTSYYPDGAGIHANQ